MEVRLFDRGDPAQSEQEVPDRLLQLRMLEDGWDKNGNPGIVVLLTGDGPATSKARASTALERMHKRGWRVEILSWGHSCNQRMCHWAQENLLDLDGTGEQSHEVIDTKKNVVTGNPDMDKVCTSFIERANLST